MALADTPKFNWGQFAAGVAMLLTSVIISTVLVQHSAAIAKNTTGVVRLGEKVNSIASTAMTVTERGALCASIATLEQSVRRLTEQVDRLEQADKRAHR